jgi:hypothetical protein
MTCRYVKDAQLMNVNSGTQIRQLLFPDACAEPVKKFKAENPDYDPAQKRAARRWIDLELHGIWGRNQPGRLQVDVKTATGAAAVSGAVLLSLVGKPGAAAKALADLDAAEAEAAAAAGNGAGSPDPNSTSSSQAAASPHAAATAAAGNDSFLDDDLSPHDLHDGDSASASGSAAAADEEEVRVVPGGHLSEQQLAALQAEAASMRLGKMYAAMGGGREGLEACLALEKLIEVRGTCLTITPIAVVLLFCYDVWFSPSHKGPWDTLLFTLLLHDTGAP